MNDERRHLLGPGCPAVAAWVRRPDPGWVGCSLASTRSAIASTSPSGSPKSRGIRLLLEDTRPRRTIQCELCSLSARIRRILFNPVRSAACPSPRRYNVRFVRVYLPPQPVQRWCGTSASPACRRSRRGKTRRQHRVLHAKPHGRNSRLSQVPQRGVLGESCNATSLASWTTNTAIFQRVSALCSLVSERLRASTLVRPPCIEPQRL